MSSRKAVSLSLTAFFALAVSALAYGSPGNACLGDAPAEPRHEHGAGHPLNGPDKAGETCDPHFTYTPGPHDPSHWGGECNAGKIQSPIDITHADKLRLPPVSFGYQPAELNIFNDCNHYQVKVLFPDNRWLTVGNKSYILKEFHFHEPAEHAVNGKRAAMAIHLVHSSPESTLLLVIEIPVVIGKENPVIRTLWEHIPEAGQEHVVPGVRIDAMDLLPADRDYYRMSGSLTTPTCNQGVTWLVLKNPIEISEPQLAEYMKHYHDTARPLQPANDRPIEEPLR
jgi:carbonic anhydrase